MTNSTAVAIRDDQTEFDERQVALLRSLGVEKANRADLALFFHVAKRTGLDPFARQIYMIERWSKDGPKQTIQTGIDGFRLIAHRVAERTGERIGYEDTEWCDSSGQWQDVWLSDEPPAAARTAILRNGQRFPGIALMSEYVQTKKGGEPTAMWASKPAGQLAKCAEALALRKAFPQDLSGIYTGDEMQHDTKPPVTAQAISASDFTTPEPEVVADVTDAEVVEDLPSADTEPEWK